ARVRRSRTERRRSGGAGRDRALGARAAGRSSLRGVGGAESGAHTFFERAAPSERSAADVHPRVARRAWPRLVGTGPRGLPSVGAWGGIARRPVPARRSDDRAMSEPI